MDAPTAAIFGAVVGASGSFVVSLMTHTIQGSREKKRETVGRYVDVVKTMAAVQQAMEWLSWHGHEQPEAVDKAMIDEYSKAVNEAFAQLMATITIIAAYNKEDHTQLLVFADTAEIVDTIIANAIRETNATKKKELYSKAFREIRDYYKSWAGMVAEMIRRIR